MTVPFRVGNHQIIRALADALDMVGVDDAHHGKRVALMVLAGAQALGWSQEWRQHVFLTALIHDCGVTSTRIHTRLIQDLVGSTDPHSHAGAALAASVPVLATFADTIRYHHTPWSALQRYPLNTMTMVAANLIYLCDRLDVLSSLFETRGLGIGRTDVLRIVRGHRGTLFRPDTIDAVLDIAESPAFWASLRPERIETALDEVVSEWDQVVLNSPEIRSIAGLFGRIVDAKSRFTARHSLGVARLSGYLGQSLGLEPEVCETLEIAGLLHDVGKLRVPDEILEKPGQLTDRERNVIRRHPLDTERLLVALFGEHPIVGWAAWHHETLDGEGYPFGLSEALLPLPARIVAVADIYQALAQDRPYRPHMERPEILGVIRRMADRHLLDGRVVEAVHTHGTDCHQAAVPEEA